jgi:hypothetical protein
MHPSSPIGGGGIHPMFETSNQTAHPHPKAQAPTPAPAETSITVDEGQSTTPTSTSKLKKSSSAETLAKRNFFNNPRRPQQKTAKSDGGGSGESVAVELPPDTTVNDGDALELEVPKDEKHDELMVKARGMWSDTINQAILKQNKTIDYLPTLPQLLI